MARKRRKPPEDFHRVWLLAIARVCCSCGWHWSNHYLKGKTDKECREECLTAWQAHAEAD